MTISSGNLDFDLIDRTATDLFNSNPDWPTFFREIMGVDGIIRRTFTRNDDLQTFYRSDIYRRISGLINKLRATSPQHDNESEPTRVITIRMPKSLHTWLVDESHLYRTSMNKLAITKLLQPLIIEPIDPFIRNTVPFKSQTA